MPFVPFVLFVVKFFSRKDRGDVAGGDELLDLCEKAATGGGIGVDSNKNLTTKSTKGTKEFL